MDEHEWLAARFEGNRPHLRAVAYRVLGSAAAVAVAATFAGRAADARLALIDGAPGMMWAQGG
jgi:hypothetical protein